MLRTIKISGGIIDGLYMYIYIYMVIFCVNAENVHWMLAKMVDVTKEQEHYHAERQQQKIKKNVRKKRKIEIEGKTGRYEAG